MASDHPDVSVKRPVTPEAYSSWAHRYRLEPRGVYKACGLTVREFFRWLAGIEVLSPEAQSRLDAVVNALNDLEQMGVDKPAVAVSIRFFDGQSILDLIGENKLIRRHLEEAAAEMRCRQEALKQIKPRNAKTPLDPVELTWMLNQG